MFTKILIANRGEIAVRIIRACYEMGIDSVAVYSQADRSALHVRLAGEALPLGPAEAAQSYLSIDKVVQAALESGAQAVHPGYGFLSENAAFAQAVQDAGLVFIGPPPSAIQAMGNKAEARARMQAAGVPVVPGYQGPDDEASLRQAAANTGYPALVKAAAGGGGKGMRVVWEAGELDESIAAARREALHAFGEGRLILERYIPRAHHVEFQVLGDASGNVLHLFERECSVQRRYQKIIEETPSPLLDEALRARMGAAAVAAAAAVGYRNAGTVEFIVNPDSREFYFLEMNTRLQVEHPVTELVTGLDLVQWQIRIAAGERLPFTQDQISQRGHAIECRLYAEDPENAFLPASGPLLRFVEPQGPGVRIDSGFTSGDRITVHYDPLIAKLIAYAGDRPAAIQKMQSALHDTVLLGLPTNWQFLQDVLSHPDFRQGLVYTTWVENEFGDWQSTPCDLPPEVLIAAALTQFQPAGEGLQAAPEGGDPYSPWKAGSQFRTGER
ncbi:MAG TPA: acetyl-CoA carboxylase biotin carboxylase subunit [Anaerolineales bacterium]